MRRIGVDTAKIRENLEKRIESETAKRLERWNQAKRDFAAITDMIRTEYRPLRIYGWGSLFDSSRFHLYSDIDVAIEGITDAATYFEILGKAMAITEITVDLVQMEKIEPVFAELIRKKGVVVYERET
jgi:predicted nucleotidyltransferase